MKSLLLIFALISLNSVQASPPPSDFLSAGQQASIVRAIDNICGDSWCEGDYDFKFNAFNCNVKSSLCDLNFQFIDRNGEQALYSKKQVCSFSGIKSYQQIMDNDRSLNQEFYNELNNCINEKEGRQDLF